MGLEVNQQKAKIMILGATDERKKGTLVVENKNQKYVFERVEQWIYLGVNITSRNNSTLELDARIAKGNKRQVHSLSHKKPRYKYTKLSSITYACETWTMNKVEKVKLERFERKILRRIYGGKRVDNQWQRRTNAELVSLYQESKITKAVSAKRLR